MKITITFEDVAGDSMTQSVKADQNGVSDDQDSSIAVFYGNMCLDVISGLNKKLEATEYDDYRSSLQ